MKKTPMTMIRSEPEKNKNIGRRDLFSEAGIRAIGDGKEGNKFELSFSSEEPCDRWYGKEILDHTEGCVDLSRLESIGVVLFNHDRDRVIGKVTRVWTENNRGMAEIEFDGDEQSKIIADKVRNETLKGVSVCYSVTNWEVVEAGAKSADGRFDGPCYIAKQWQPMEISIVSVPADPTVGVGREYEPVPPQRADKPAEASRLSYYESLINSNLNA